MDLGSRIKGAILGGVVALVGVTLDLSPVGWRLEESLGLDNLFRLRGVQPSPEDVAIVTIDRLASRHFQLPNIPRKWPRSMHARVIDRLHAAGARVIAFDMDFREPREAGEDQALAKAMRSAANIVLFEHLHQDKIETDGTAPALRLEQRVPPLALFADAAAALAPFPLPKVPVTVRRAWSFKPSIGDAATLPAVAVQFFARSEYATLYRLLTARDPSAVQIPARLDIPPHAETMDRITRELRRTFQTQPALRTQLAADLDRSADLSAAARQRLQALLAMYAGPDSPYLNYYGPPGTVRTLSYRDVLERLDPAALRERVGGRTVFVGFAEHFQPEQRDNFYSVYSRDSGLDVSGVEIAATLFANLLHRQTVQPLATANRILLILAWGFGLALWLRAGPIVFTTAGAVLLGAGYVALSVTWFRASHLWMPQVVPVLVQLPLAIIATLAWRYRDVHRERQNIQRAFGYHLPGHVVDRLARGVERLGPSAESIYGVCLASDAQQYTALSESLPPTELHTVLNRYYERLFTPVRRHTGIVSDVVGDAMLAIWAAPVADPELCRKACRAALEIKANTCQQTSASEAPSTTLPTRIGIHCGAISLGHVGAVDHFEYRAVGDIVNTANRIEQLGKELGCYVLASAEVVAGADDVISRELGRFMLKGKRETIVVHELLGLRSAPDAADQDTRARQFALGLAHMHAQAWCAARDAFQEYDARFGPDGPARYYLTQLESLTAADESAWTGVWQIS